MVMQKDLTGLHLNASMKPGLTLCGVSAPPDHPVMVGDDGDSGGPRGYGASIQAHVLTSYGFLHGSSCGRHGIHAQALISQELDLPHRCVSAWQHSVFP